MVNTPYEIAITQSDSGTASVGHDLNRSISEWDTSASTNSRLPGKRSEALESQPFSPRYGDGQLIKISEDIAAESRSKSSGTGKVVSNREQTTDSFGTAVIILGAATLFVGFLVAFHIFPATAPAKSPEEEKRLKQIEKNQGAIALLESWLAEDNDVDDQEEWDEFVRLTDEDRPPGQKVFSKL